jgi:2-polyprenyl-6-methoxyphenol hydroxylase-like FAD-dependent oxidoreductase
MTPYLGKGATNAIVDGMALAEALKVAEDKKELVPRLAEYEKSMVKRGFAAAKESMLVHHLVFAAGSMPWRT